MEKSAGLAKAAAMMALVAALATLLVVSVEPPAAQTAHHARGREMRMQGIPVPATTPRGGAGAAQERGTAAGRREAGGGRAPANSSGSEQ